MISGRLWQRLLLVLGLLLSGCASAPQCRRELPPQWVDVAALRADVERLAAPTLAGRQTGTPGAQLARQFLAERFAASGLRPVDSKMRLPPALWHLPGSDSRAWIGEPPYFQPFSYDGLFSRFQGVNVVGLLPATDDLAAKAQHRERQGLPPAGGRWRLVLAHYDHLGQRGSRHYPGADDNASGVAALLALAKQAATDPSRPADLNLLFVATDAEENGLHGAEALAERLSELDIRPELVINLDMLGHPGHPYAIYMEGGRNFNNPEQLETLIESNGLCARLGHARLGRSLDERVNYLKASDHYPFHRRQIPWLYFGVPPHPQYHSVEDTPQRLNYGFLAATTEAVYNLLWHRLTPSRAAPEEN